jgi:hypothetical protein
MGDKYLWYFLLPVEWIWEAFMKKSTINDEVTNDLVNYFKEDNLKSINCIRT